MSKTPQIGIWSLINSFQVLQILLEDDLDFIVFDFEHGNWRRDQLTTAVQMCKLAGKNSVVRIPSISPEWNQVVHDARSDIVQIAGVKSQQDLNAITAMIVSPPSGQLGYSPWTTMGRLNGLETSFYPKITIQIEDSRFLQEFLDGDLSIAPVISSIFVGRYDLSVSLGCPGRIDDQRVINALTQARLRATQLGLALGTVVSGETDLVNISPLGMDFLSIESDVLRLMGRRRQEDTKWT